MTILHLKYKNDKDHYAMNMSNELVSVYVRYKDEYKTKNEMKNCFLNDELFFYCL